MEALAQTGSSFSGAMSPPVSAIVLRPILLHLLFSLLLSIETRKKLEKYTMDKFRGLLYARSLNGEVKTTPEYINNAYAPNIEEPICHNCFYPRLFL